jgi:carboxylesterase
LLKPLRLNRLVSRPQPVTDYADALERIAALQQFDTAEVNPLNRLVSRPQPVTDYTEALERIAALQQLDTPEVNPLCRLHLLTHGRRTARAIIFWHGYTSSPRQFHQLGQIFFEQGYNVLVPRLPHHGLTDRLAPDQSRLTAEDLAALVDGVTDLAHGLGQRVTVVGFSAGGVLAGWTAQHRADVEQVVVISPVFWLKSAPAAVTRPFVKLILTLPNFYRWWDPVLKADALGPQHGYPRYSSRALGQILRLGLAVRVAASSAKPAAGSIVVVTNPNDWAVDNVVTKEVAARWRHNGAGNLKTYEFAVTHELPHEIIDPDHDAARTDLVYPVLVDLISANMSS